MKKIIPTLMALVLVLSMFTACSLNYKTTGTNAQSTVTSENVTDLFKPALNSYAKYMGSDFYDLEKNDSGDPEIFSLNNNHVNSYSEDMQISTNDYLYKIIGITSANDLIAKIGKYISEDVIKIIIDKSTLINDTDGNLYLKASSIDNRAFDTASIKLIKTDGDKYYVSVDYYDNNGKYVCSPEFITTLKDGELFIESKEGNICKSADEINAEGSRNLVYTYEKFKYHEQQAVTEQNVKDLFKTALGCYVCFEGSYLYEVERDSSGKLTNYSKDSNGNEYHKVLGFKTFDELKNKISLYTPISNDKNNILLLNEKDFIEENGNLYVKTGDCGTANYDLNSIRLMMVSGDKYYIGVNREKGSGTSINIPYSVETSVFQTTLKDGYLYLEKELDTDICEGTDITCPSSPHNLINLFSKFFSSADTKASISDEDQYIDKYAINSYIYEMGSYFYTVQRDENGDAIVYSKDANGNNQYKVLGYSSVDEIKNIMRQYMSDNIIEKCLSKGTFEIKDGSLYVAPDSSTVTAYNIFNMPLGKIDNNNIIFTIQTFNPDTGKYLGTRTFTTVIEKGLYHITDVSDDLTQETQHENFTPIASVYTNMRFINIHSYDM